MLRGKLYENRMFLYRIYRRYALPAHRLVVGDVMNERISLTDKELEELLETSEDETDAMIEKEKKKQKRTGINDKNADRYGFGNTSGTSRHGCTETYR